MEANAAHREAAKKKQRAPLHLLEHVLEVLVRVKQCDSEGGEGWDPRL